MIIITMFIRINESPIIFAFVNFINLFTAFPGVIEPYVRLISKYFVCSFGINCLSGIGMCSE